MRKDSGWLITGLVAMILFCGLGVSVLTQATWLQTLDNGGLNAVHPLIDSSRTQVMALIAQLASPPMDIVWSVIIAVVVWRGFHEQLTAIWLLVVLFSGDAVAFVFKEIVRRPRPALKVIPDSGFSFPSGHVFGAAIVALAIIFILIPQIKEQEIQFVVGLLTVIWLSLVVFSRIYLRAHYPSDTAGSLLLALAWWACLELGWHKYQSHIHLPQFRSQRKVG